VVYPGILHYARTAVTAYATAAAAALITQAYEAGTVVVGKVGQYSLKIGERTLTLSNQGGIQKNWKQNAGKLRELISNSAAIRDAHVDPTSGALLPDRKPDGSGSFLTMERALLRDRGYTYDQESRQWLPPPDRE
jgi:hypothetical protein